MGAGASKQAGKAAAAAGRRQYPSSPSTLNSATSTSKAPSTTNAPRQETRPPAPSQVHPNPEAAPPSENRSKHIDLDGRDPQFGAALRSLGPAASATRGTEQDRGVFPTSSQPPVGQQGQNIFPQRGIKNNPSLMIVQTRERIAQRFEEEADGLGRASFAGRTLLSAKDLHEVLRLRDQVRKSNEEIEKSMRLKPGVLSRLSVSGVVANA